MASKSGLSVLQQRIDFLKLKNDGHRLRPCDWLTVNFALNTKGVMRCGWTLPRQVGPAVVRNRLKRWSRVYFRNVIATESQLPVDINLVFRKSDDDFFKKLDYESFASVVDKSWRQIRQSIGQKTGRKTVQSVGKKTGQKAGPKVKEPASNQGEDK